MFHELDHPPPPDEVWTSKLIIFLAWHGYMAYIGSPTSKPAWSFKPNSLKASLYLCLVIFFINFWSKHNRFFYKSSKIAFGTLHLYLLNITNNQSVNLCLTLDCRSDKIVRHAGPTMIVPFWTFATKYSSNLHDTLMQTIMYDDKSE